MQNERHDRLSELFERAIELSPDARGRFIEVCSDDPAVRSELRSLLAAHDRTPNLLERIAGDVLPAALQAVIDQDSLSADAGPAQRLASTPQVWRNAAPSLEPGRRLGTYTIQRRIAAGGLGIVYHAFDTALQREVAIKTLALSRPDARETLLREARAASALNHPHICTIYEVGEHDGISFIAMEYVEGRPLRDVIPNDGLPTELILRYGRQVAEAVEHAHRQGILHRDLKSANVMVSAESQAKVLDFGLASRIPAAELETLTQTRVAEADVGSLAGTLPYLAPELLRGNAASKRTDVWALGVLLYEIAAGSLPFRGSTPFDLTAAILEGSPAPLPAKLPMPLRAVIGRCLARDPPQRYQHAGEVRVALETLQLGTDPSLPVRDESQTIAGHEPWRHRRLPIAGIVAELLAGAASETKSRWLGLSAIALVLLVAASYWAGLLRPSHAPPVFHQLTFQQGFIESATYAPGGDTVVFAASWEGGPSELYSLRVDSPTGVRPLGISAGRVLGVSRKGEIAFLQGLGDPNGTAATLAIAPLGAGSPRQILEDILSADWSPAKDDLAVSHRMGGGFRLEYPVGKVVRETSGFFDSVRFSPDGEHIAVVEHPVIGDSAGFVEVLDLSGHAQVLTRKWLGWVSVAWEPSGKEIWFTASDTPNQSALYAVSLNGKQRMLASVPGTIVIQSVLPSGRALIIDAKARHGLMVSTPDHPNERDFSWFEWPDNPVFSPDGKSIAFTETSVATGGEFTVFSRKLTGEPAVRLAQGWGGQTSPDGRWVLAVRSTEHPQLWLHPLGPGEPRQLTRPPVELGDGEWFPDSTRIAFTGRENGVWRTYLADLAGNVKPLTPPRAIGRPLTPDGKFLVTRYPDRSVKLLPVDGGQPLPIRGFEGTDLPLRFSNDAKYLFVYTMESPVLLKIWKIDIASGRREFVKAVGPSDPAGVYVTLKLALGPDLRSYAYIYGRRLSSLYEVEDTR
jgi:serine/threonine protein kinase/Tol biopolymer transport system component